MAGGYKNLSSDPYEELRRQLDEARLRLAELERPTGTQVYDTLATLRDLINNLATEIANVASSGAVWMGGVSSGAASISASSGNITTSSGDFYTPHGRATPVVTSYVAAYINSDGRVGATPSARRFKRDVHPHHWTLEQIETAIIVTYQLRALYGRMGADAPYEFGVIAEQLDHAGLAEFVVRDADGRAFSVAYERLALLALSGVQQLIPRMQALESRLDAAGL